ncbi:MAG: DUF411 domain-containing protein [Gemmatimonadetes bacterium]|nr:DUF411 domain-containing protein [Gemmatimonadota bacterium]
MAKHIFPLAKALVLVLAGTALVACGGEAPAAERTQLATAAGDADVVVYKSPTCGCCNGWIEHMREAGFEVEPVDVGYGELGQRKTEAGIPHDLGSCHTATAGAYSVEGHVPAATVARLLKERPEDVRGIAVPGMPTGSPGMEGPNPQPYDVIAIRKDGSRFVYETVYPTQPDSDTR